MIYISALLAFVLQLSFCLLIRKVILRLLPLLLAVVGNGILLVMIFTTDGFWELLGDLFFFAAALLALGACALAWVAFGVVCLIRSHLKKNKSRPQNCAPHDTD